MDLSKKGMDLSKKGILANSLPRFRMNCPFVGGRSSAGPGGPVVPPRSCADLKTRFPDLDLNPPFCLAGQKSIMRVMGLPGFLEPQGARIGVGKMTTYHLAPETPFVTVTGDMKKFSDWLALANGVQEEDDEETYPFPLLDAVGEYPWRKRNVVPDGPRVVTIMLSLCCRII